MERPNTLRMSTIALDWLDITLILSILAACAVVGWLAGCLIRRFDIAVRDRKIRLRHQPPYAQDGVRATALNDGTFHGRQAIAKAYAKYDFGRWQVSNYSTKIYRLTPGVGNEVVRPVHGAPFTPSPNYLPTCFQVYQKRQAGH